MKTFPAILVTGPRQSGKTTLLQSQLQETHRFVSLENLDIRARAIEDPIGFIKHHPPPVILDEIQHAPQLLSYIKDAIDRKRTAGQWILSGSQNFVLMQGVTQSLAGRIAILELLPMSVAESQGDAAPRTVDDLLSTLRRQPHPTSCRYTIDMADWLLRGAYPEMRINKAVDRQMWCSGYLQTYLERDVRQICNVNDIHSFERFLRLCAARTGQILSISELARDTGVSVPTAKSWLSILEASYQIFLLQPYFENFGKRVIKSPKLYFLDTALVTYLTGQHQPEAVMNGPMKGALIETAVIAQWLKAFKHNGELPSMYYWRSRDGLEIDLLIDRNNELYPMEIKATSTILPAHADNIRKWIDTSKQSGGSGALLADIPSPIPLPGDIAALPWHMGI